jgi:hypothetical protein
VREEDELIEMAGSGSPDLREKFIKTESELFRHRFESDDANERQEFLKSLKFDWVTVSVGSIRSESDRRPVVWRTQSG